MAKAVVDSNNGQTPSSASDHLVFGLVRKAVEKVRFLAYKSNGNEDVVKTNGESRVCPGPQP